MGDAVAVFVSNPAKSPHDSTLAFHERKAKQDSPDDVKRAQILAGVTVFGFVIVYIDSDLLATNAVEVDATKTQLDEEFTSWPTRRSLYLFKLAKT